MIVVEEIFQRLQLFGSKLSGNLSPFKSQDERWRKFFHKVDFAY